MTGLHEDLRRESSEPTASDRSVGLVFAAVFLVIGVQPLLKGAALRPWALIVAAAIALIAYTIPRLLHPLNRVWMSIGKLLHRIVSPVVLGLLYVVAVVPTGLYLRMRGADPLRLKRDPAAKSYWIPRSGAPGSFKNQF